MGYIKQNCYTIKFYNYNFNPADSTTYYIADGESAGSTTYLRNYATRAATIGKVIVAWYNGTQNCTAEDTDFSIRVNNTTDYLIYSGSFANAQSPQTKNWVGAPLEAGDYFHLKLATPAWVTNPQGTYLFVTAEVIY